MSEFDAWKAQEAAAYLEGVRDTLMAARKVQDELDVMESLLPAMGGERVRHDSAPDAMENAALRIIELRERYATELATYAAVREEAREAIGKLGDVRYEGVLTLYYLDGHAWRTVGVLMGYEEQTVRNLRGEALPLFWEVMPRNARTMVPRAD